MHLSSIFSNAQQVNIANSLWREKERKREREKERKREREKQRKKMFINRNDQSEIDNRTSYWVITIQDKFKIDFSCFNLVRVRMPFCKLLNAIAIPKQNSFFNRKRFASPKIRIFRILKRLQKDAIFFWFLFRKWEFQNNLLLLL